MEEPDTIIVLDDDPGTVEVVRTGLSILRPLWQVLAARDTGHALALLEEHPVSALVTDWIMPVTDGLETARMVRDLEERTGSLRFVVVLTSRPADARVEALRIANEFVSKPPDPRELEALLSQGLRTTRRANELLARVRDLGLLAQTDPLTGVANRRHGTDILAREMQRWRRTADSLSVLMVDLDHFKRINDTWGHQTGDTVLVTAARRMQDHLRPFDSLVRWGGEEFLVILPHTGPHEGWIVAERLRLALRQPIPTPFGGLTATASIGVASVRGGLDDVALLVSEADQAMYRAKERGRDQVVGDSDAPRFVPDPVSRLEEPPPPPPPPRRGQGLLAALVCAVLAGGGCRIADPPPDAPLPPPRTTGSLEAPEGFDFDMSDPTGLEVQVDAPDGSPYPQARVCLLSASSSPIECRPTDDRGRVSFRAAADPDGFRLVATAVGVPADTVEVPFGTGSVRIPGETAAPTAQGVVAGRTLAWSLGSPASLGLPRGLDTTRRAEVTTSLLSDVNFAFPESRPVPVWHPEYLEASAAEEIVLRDSAEVTITFLHEGAGYRNSFGVYVLAPGEVMSSARVLDKRIVFPNASLVNSGGGLRPGDRVRLGSFPAGTRIGFLVVANGWNGSTVDTLSRPVYYSRPELNPEVLPDRKRHVALLWHEPSQRAILGFEDLDRGSSGCDNDFNDVLFTVSWNPFPAVDVSNLAGLPGRTDSDGDGASDNVDEFPFDPLRAWERWFPSRDAWGTLAFEDLWPSRGDFDYNDFVARYRAREIRSADQKVRDVEFQLLPVAAGASLRHGISLGLGRLAQAPESAWVRAGERRREGIARRDPGSETTVLRLWNDVFGLFPGAGNGLINTLPGTPLLAADTVWARVVLATPADLADPPYDPFLVRAADSSHEVHLPDRAPSPWMRRNLLRTRDDRSDSVTGAWYRGAGRLPWALVLPGTWRPPLEGVDLLRAYPAFADWVGSAGRTDLDWPLRPGDPSLLMPP